MYYFAMNYEELKSEKLLRLIERANSVFNEYADKEIKLCSIINAKSGACSEDCKFCAQSRYNNAKSDVYPLLDKEKILAAARRARENHATNFGIVTSGDKMTGREVDKIADIIFEMKRQTDIEPCASLGHLSEEHLRRLKDAGLTQFHHNIETSPRFYKHIVSTHRFEDRVETIRAAKKVGLKVCSGGIFGLGETMDDRIEMARLLRELDVDGIPINILVPIAGTPLEGQPPLPIDEILRSIAIFRIILKDKVIKLAAGRESRMKDFQPLAFMAGANGMIIGGYLTIRGRSVDEDLAMVENLNNMLFTN